MWQHGWTGGTNDALLTAGRCWLGFSVQWQIPQQLMQIARNNVAVYPHGPKVGFPQHEDAIKQIQV